MGKCIPRLTCKKLTIITPIQASDMSYNPDPNAVIPRNLAATLNVLRAAAKVPSVARVILTSSVVAACPAIVAGKDSGHIIIDVGQYMLEPLMSNRRLTQSLDTWNEPAVMAAWDHNTPDAIKSPVVYVASKVEAEKAAWRWVEEHRPHFEFNTVLPNMNVSCKICHCRHGPMSSTVNRN